MKEWKQEESNRKAQMVGRRDGPRIPERPFGLFKKGGFVSTPSIYLQNICVKDCFYWLHETFTLLR